MSKSELIITETTVSKIEESGIERILNTVRPVWKSRNLIQRVERLLPVDPSSACQRLLNAAFHDLKEKIVTIGVDIAKTAAEDYKLPPIVREEDILEYNPYKTIDLAYRIGLLSRPEWRRLHRCYEIRRDLEHEDNEYEAVIEDCVYIFNSSIDIVLSKDPITLLRVSDVKEIVENSSRQGLNEECIDNFERAPSLRQEEIMKFLIGNARSASQPDVVRENCFEALQRLNIKAQNTVIIAISKLLEQKLGSKPLDMLTAKLGYASNSFGYFKKVKRREFYQSILEDIVNSQGNWDREGDVMKRLEEIGGLKYCPDPLLKDFVREMSVVYIGAPGGYGHFGSNRSVFYSNSAAPVIRRIVEEYEFDLSEILEDLRNDKKVKGKLVNKDIVSRFELLVDYATKYEEVEEVI